MHTKGEEECGTNVAGENGLAVWMSSGLCIYPHVTLTYTEMVVGDALGFPWPQNASGLGDLGVVALWCGWVPLLLLAT